MEALRIVRVTGVSISLGREFRLVVKHVTTKVVYNY